MKKLFAISSLLLVLAACGSQVVEFPEQGASDVLPDSGYPPFGDLPDAGEPDEDADVPNAEPDAGKPDSGDPDSGKPDAGKPDGGSCNNSCCENKCDSILVGCKAKCEKECAGWEKKKCLYQCECEHDACVKCCK